MGLMREFFEASSALRNEIKRVMGAEGVTQADLARRLGTSRQWVGQVVHGERSDVRLRTISNIASALGYEVVILFDKRSGR